MLLYGEYEAMDVGHEAAGPTAGHQGPQDVAATPAPPALVTLQPHNISPRSLLHFYIVIIP